jgi:hypothetical protein
MPADRYRLRSSGVRLPRTAKAAFCHGKDEFRANSQPFIQSGRSPVNFKRDTNCVLFSITSFIIPSPLPYSSAAIFYNKPKLKMSLFPF